MNNNKYCDFKNSLTCPVCGYTARRYPHARLCRSIETKPKPVIGGPGTELKKILKKFGFKQDSNCQCNARAKYMDIMEANEPGWCENHIDEIVVWLKEEAIKRKILFIDSLAKILIKRAIKNAKKQCKN